MSSSTSQIDRRRLLVGWAGLVSLIAVAAAVLLPASASAAACPVNPGNATTWIGGSGSFGDEGNWSNGTPTATCDVTVAPVGSPVITMTAGANTKSFTLGGTGSTPKLIISVQSPNTNLDAQPGGITIAAGASVVLTCPPSPGECTGGAGSGAHLYSGPSLFLNAGTITVDANSGTGAEVGGVVNNTGTIAFEKSASLSGQVTNKGSITVANGATVFNWGSHCGDTGPFVKNDTNGAISGAGTLSVRNFEQGDGSTGNVEVPCGTLKYTGSGASSIRASGGFDLSGESKANQSLTVSAASANTNVRLVSDFTSNGPITLTCPEGGCAGGSGSGVGINANGHAFTNAGTLTVLPASGTGAYTDSNGGSFTNTGTMIFEQDAALKGVTTNQGEIQIANTKTVTSAGSSCGDTGPRVVNDTGGSINATGTGTLKANNYEQGNGTTSGTLPVQIPCGTLKYTGTGASTVQVNAILTPMTGNIAAGQTLRLIGGITSAPFVNAGTIVFDQAAGNPTVGASTVTNTGTLRGVGTIAGSVQNDGIVQPGDTSPGTLTLSGNYTQGAGGRLDIEIGGTGAGQFDALAVSGNATLGGTVALIPTGGFLSSAAVGDNVSFLTYGGPATGAFATTTVNPALTCPKQMSVSNDTGIKALKATVVDSGASCGGGGGGGGGGSTPPPTATPPAPVPNTKLGVHPGPRITTKLAKLKVKFGFSSEVAGATFECKLDKSPYKACKSPKSFTVKPGKHKFSVRAVGPGGTDTTPVSFKFKVIKQKG